jgi:hypothetical protein
MAVAPDDFGKFGDALLVGNFGDSHVSAFNLKTGRFLGQLEDASGQPLVLNGGFHGPDTKGLWGIGFGKGEGGAGKHTLFFTAGINDEADGVFGKVTRARGEDDDQGDQGNQGNQGRNLSQIGKHIGKDLGDIQADATKLAKALASVQVSASVTTDLNMLNTDLSKVVADLAAGRAATSDLQATITAEVMLTADLGTSATPKIKHTLRDLGDDLLNLAIEIAAMKG